MKPEGLGNLWSRYYDRAFPQRALARRIERERVQLFEHVNSINEMGQYLVGKIPNVEANKIYLLTRDADGGINKLVFSCALNRYSHKPEYELDFTHYFPRVNSDEANGLTALVDQYTACDDVRKQIEYALEIKNMAKDATYNVYTQKIEYCLRGDSYIPLATTLDGDLYGVSRSQNFFPHQAEPESPEQYHRRISKINQALAKPQSVLEKVTLQVKSNNAERFPGHMILLPAIDWK